MVRTGERIPDLELEAPDGSLVAVSPGPHRYLVLQVLRYYG